MLDRDLETLRMLDRAEDALSQALKLMPNDVRSAFDPMEAVPPIETALRQIRGVAQDARDAARLRSASE
jgi:hypothetical protein